MQPYCKLYSSVYQHVINTETLVINNPIKESKGLSQHEITLLLLIIENQLTDEDSVPVYYVKNDMGKAGFNGIAFSISIRELLRKEFIETLKVGDQFNEEFLACRLTKKGEDWIMSNQENIEFKSNPKNVNEDLTKDLPF